ncbi:MAG: hypothetical protein ACK5GN_02460 [Pseudomonadota bacterium]
MLTLLLGCSSIGSSGMVDHAEELLANSHHKEAIVAYRNHIQNRLAAADRPEWENPHFYLLRIADIELEMGEPVQALETCTSADAHGVDAALITDRYRAIANWYIERRELDSAFKLLQKHRQRDPLLFDAMLDRVGREITGREGL